MSSRGYYSLDELDSRGIRTQGKNVKISTKVSLYLCEGGLEIGDHVRIDDYCVLVGDIIIGNHVHIASHSGIHASQGGRIIFEDFSGISSNVQIQMSP